MSKGEAKRNWREAWASCAEETEVFEKIVKKFHARCIDTLVKNVDAAVYCFDAAKAASNASVNDAA
ncbi:MAG TPA: hypothetical protein DEB39_06575 [Planctomycetaceae bacterium]|nr:hypothetical protein [Planctomycetaceae bacterium]